MTRLQGVSLSAWKRMVRTGRAGVADFFPFKDRRRANSEPRGRRSKYSLVTTDDRSRARGAA
jgi:hypothetical protein